MSGVNERSAAGKESGQFPRRHVLKLTDMQRQTYLETLAEHGVTARRRLREGATAEILVDAPDGVEIQLQDVSYCGGRGVLGNMCG